MQELQPGKDHVASAVDEVIEPILAGALVGDGEIELTPGGGDGPQVAVEVGPVAGFDGVEVKGLIRAVRPADGAGGHLVVVVVVLAQPDPAAVYVIQIRAL